MGYGQGLPHVLLDQKHGNAVFAYLSYDAEVVIDQRGGQPQGRFVDDKELGFVHESAADGHHGLFAARAR